MSGPRGDFRNRLRISVETLAVQLVLGIGSGWFAARSRYSGKSLVESYLEG